MKIERIQSGATPAVATQSFARLLAVLAVSMLVFLGFQTTALAGKVGDTYVRYEAHSPEAASDILALATAMEQMRNAPCDSPLSWYYQGAIHWLPTSASDLANLAENPLCSSYTQSHNLLKDAWDNCTHDVEHKSEPHFLAWHRLFTYHLEKVVRSLSGNHNFALPYWGYVDLDTTDLSSLSGKLTLPTQFQFWNQSSLLESARYTNLNFGLPIESNFAQQNLVEAVEALDNPISFEDFNSTIDPAPHGAMHRYIGSGPDGTQLHFNSIYNRTDKGLMALVPSAAFDPIFWLHHAEIDRLWVQWTEKYHTYLTAEELESASYWPYVFFDPDSSSPTGWVKVSYSTSQDVADAIYNLDYRYDDTGLVSVPSSTLASFAAAAPSAPAKTKVASSTPQVTVGEQRPATLSVTLPAELPSLKSNLLSLRAVEPTAPKGYAIEVEVSYVGAPSGFYSVYANLPDEEAKNDLDTYFVGAFSFFVNEADRRVSRSFRLDITDELLAQLDTSGADEISDEISFFIEKMGGPDYEEVQIENVTLYTY